MDLGDGGCGNCRTEIGKHGLKILVQGLRHRLFGQAQIKGRQLVLKSGQGQGHICAHQITPCRQDLTQLDKGRPHGFQGKG